MAATIQTIEKPTRARALDTSGNNNHGQIYSGRALEFDGSTDYLTYTSTEELEEFTAVGWINCYGDTGVIQNIWDGNAGGTYPAIYNGTPKISWYAPVVNWMQTGKVIEYNTWYRVVFVFKRNGSAADYRVYINGIEDTGGDFPATGVGTYTNGKFDGIGSIGQGTSRLFNGMMSDMQVWNTSWTAKDVLYDYNNPEQLALNRGGTSLTNSNLKIWYPMNDGHRGQQSYILDASNTGLGDELLTTTDLTTIGNQAITAGTTLNGWTHHATYQYDSVTASSDGIRIISNGSNDLGSAYQSFHTNPFVITAGKTYRLEYSFTVHSGAFALNVMNNPVGSSAGITRNGITGTENNTVKYFTASSNADASNYIEIYSSSTNAFDATISYVSLKPVNDKNHATTVFKGDELITVAKDKNMDASNNWDVSSANWSIDGNSLDYDGSGGGNATLDQTYPAFVAGRTYEMKFNTSANDTIITIKDGDGSNTFVAETTYTSGTKTVTFVAPATTDGLMFTAGGSSGAFAIDWINIKELGVASGWTDADQQLDIPQTALQSYNQLAWFDGARAFVNCDSQIDTDANDWSLSFWVYFKDQGDSFIFPMGDTSTKNIVLKKTSTGLGLYYRDEGGSYHVLSSSTGASGPIQENQWLHIVITADGDTSMKGYINAKLNATNSDMTSTHLQLQNFMNGHGSYFTLGTINEISYYNDILTQTEVNDLYNDGKAKSALDASGSGGLVGYWINNGLSEWKDLKGSNDANLVNTDETILITAGADATRDSQGFLMNRQKLTNSLNLDYNQSYNLIRKGLDTDNITADGGSFSVWIYPTDMGGGDYGRIFEKGGIHYCYIQAFSSDTCKLVYTTKFSSSGICNFTTDNRNITLNEWNYIAVTYDGSATGNAALIYVNGVLVDSSEDETRSGTIVDDSGHDMYVGNRADFIRHFDGQIDDLNFYSDILTAAEVKRNYNAGKRSHR